MPSRHVVPPWEFLLSASRNSLQSYELSRLGHAANLRKEVAPMLDQWVEETAAALLARWLLEHHQREPVAQAEAVVGTEQGISGSYNFFANSPFPERNPRQGS